MSLDAIFHAGEIAVQERTGERAIARRHASMIRGRLTGGARGFLQSQGVVAAGALAPDGSIWASLWCGAEGFLRADDLGGHLGLDAALDHTDAADPVRQLLRAGEPLALLVIDFARRGRLRVNGIVRNTGATGLDLEIRETFGNCVKYIQRRLRLAVAPDGDVAPPEHGVTLDQPRRDFVARTDTLFVASVHRERGLDVSHRGGHPGFVRVVDDRTLRIPDYQGNSLYQTLGNLTVDARAGLALVDFDRRRVLSLSGSASIEFGAEDPAHSSGGTGRYWSLTVDRWVELPLPSTMRWTLVERSPFNP